MVAALVDHLWQSTQFCALTALLALLVRASFARLRLWMWRIAALKFLLPFALPYAAGQWLGFPMPHSSDPPPPLLVEWIADWTPVFRPARTFGAPGISAFLMLPLAMIFSYAGALWIRRHLRLTQTRVAAEAARAERDIDDTPRGPGFFASALLTACAILSVAAPTVAGAIADLQRRRDALISNSRSLRAAPAMMTAAAPGMGAQFRVTADAGGVLIRNATVQELLGLAYGVHPYYVRTDHFHEAGQPDWLRGPRYDVRVVGPVREPGRFDAYALREAISSLLAQQFGLTIFLNNQCQPPCGRYQVAMPEARLAHDP
jgi:hypothetical protein